MAASWKEGGGGYPCICSRNTLYSVGWKEGGGGGGALCVCVQLDTAHQAGCGANGVRYAEPSPGIAHRRDVQLV